MTILEKIAAQRRIEIEVLKRVEPLDDFIDALCDLPPSRFRTALEVTDRVNVIAEIKKGSPSKGIMSENFNPGELAMKYRVGGAAAISVLTEQSHFFGSFENLAMARDTSGLPVLCKDFVVDRYQIFYARHRGADAVLLITALHTPASLARNFRLAAQVGIDCLVEVHDREELQIALDAGATIVGVNNRNLKDFSVSLETSEGLAGCFPEGVIKVAESGILERSDIERLQACGYSSFLIGEALVTADDPAALLKSLRGVL